MSSGGGPRPPSVVFFHACPLVFTLFYRSTGGCDMVPGEYVINQMHRRRGGGLPIFGSMCIDIKEAT